MHSELERMVLSMELILNSYYKNNAQKLHTMVDKILLKFGGLSNKDMDDFYSLANEVFVDVLKRYDGMQSFDGFLFSCLSNKIKTEMTRRNRYKRQADRMSISIDTPVGDDENVLLSNVIADKNEIERTIFESEEVGYSEKMLLYLSRLSSLQKEILRLTIAGYKSHEIKEELHISEKQYADANAAIHSYRNVSVLF